jgi:RimJ/RimL family protein N-acetyltransferase
VTCADAPPAAPYATERLAIEPLVPSHTTGLHAALDDPSVGRFLPRPDVTTPDALRARIERLAAGPLPHTGERWWNFAVLLHADRTIIGRLEATTYGEWGEIAYVFGPRWWGQGLASEATRWLLGHLAKHGVTELWAAVHAANQPSKRLLTRLGFAAVGELSRPVASFDPGDVAFVRRS